MNFVTKMKWDFLYHFEVIRIVSGIILCEASVDLHIDRHKCGQTSRLIVRAEIPPSCNVKARLCTFNLFLVNWYFFCIYEQLLES